MRIGQLADRTGTPVTTIRYYEQVGVLAEPIRRASGYRDYPEDAVDRLRFVRAAQMVGLTLGEVREIIAFRDRDQVPCAHVHGLIHQRKAELADRIAELERIRDDLQLLAERARSLDPKDCDPSSACHLLTPLDRRHAQRPVRTSSSPQALPIGITDPTARP